MKNKKADHPDADIAKGAVEQDARDQETNTSLSGQLPHRNRSLLSDTHDTDFPEPGMNEEHTGEPQGAPIESRQLNPNPQRETRDQEHSREVNPEGQSQDQDPGRRQKQNQNQKKDDPQAA